MSEHDADACFAAFEERRDAQARVRKSIAANVEGLGCGGANDACPRPSGDAYEDHEDNCPIAIAAAIREGRL